MAPKKSTKKATTKATKDTKKTTKKAVKKKITAKKITRKTDNKVQTKRIKQIYNNIGKRKYFHSEPDIQDLPNLIEIQLDSYEKFLNEGVKELIEEISPIVDFSGKKLELQFVGNEIGEPKYEPGICKMKNLTYEAPLKVHVQLINKQSGEIKEQDVFLGSIPLMTPRGSFIVNGIERVVVSQLVRSPGVFFANNPAAPHYGTAKIIPKRGAWLEIETDKRGIISVKIDRKRKIPVTSLLRIFGYEKDEDIKKALADVNTGEVDFILNTLEKDNAKTVDEAYQNIYKKLRPGDLATPENARSLIESMFFDYRKYDMGPVARYKLNQRFELKIKNIKENHTFQKEDFLLILKHLINLNNGEVGPDDIDHLSNRRIRPVGELVQNKFRVGLLRTDRIAKDRMTVMDLETVTPTQLINSRPITAALREFFASSQLSQFMDQINPLSELAHKRRLSAMGPGGLSRERASFDVRDVHTSHYGRICPIATPEGPNIGLVVHLATFARINAYGFIETPFYKVSTTIENKASKLVGRIAGETIKKGAKEIVKKGKTIDKKAAEAIEKIKDLKEVKVAPYATSQKDYFDAEEEAKLVVAQASSNLDAKKQFLDKHVSARINAEATMADISEVTHMDVSPKQIISVTTSLIPFLENDDSTRASMGSNMQRQSVPLVKTEAPIVGTGMEEVAAKNSGQVIVAEENGIVTEADANNVTVLYDSGRKETYPLMVYERSNQATCMHQRLVVQAGDKVKLGDILAEGAAIDSGELALGKNLLVAYMAWQGYNFEDAVIISDRMVKDEVFNSIHIEEYSIDVRDTKLGPEQITRDIPNVGEAKLKDLDEDGIIRVGASVEEGDILVGKITPKGETELTAEERLLRAIFGDKARDVKDTSLRLPGGAGGKVVGIQIFVRSQGDELPTGVIKQIKVSVAQTRKISIGDKIAGRHGNKGVISTIVPQEDMPHLEDGTPVDIILNPIGVISRMNIGQILETHMGWAAMKEGYKVAAPAFESPKSETILEALKEAGLPEDGKAQLYDGRTGEPFDRKTTVGITYILKLNHLVEDKIHARSVGPYSLVTQQPLGGKAQHGGQRFGEMEVWALEAYGAAHTLQEMLTIKSDDVHGRAKAYEAIVKEEDIQKPNIPESFNVLVKELQSLGLSVKLLNISPEVEEQSHKKIEASADEAQESSTEETKESSEDNKEEAQTA